MLHIPIFMRKNSKSRYIFLKIVFAKQHCIVIFIWLVIAVLLVIMLFVFAIAMYSALELEIVFWMRKINALMILISQELRVYK